MQASFPPFLRPNPLYSPAESAESLASRASKIRLLLLDVDGVLSDGRLYFSNSGEEMKTFHTLDGQGIRQPIFGLALSQAANPRCSHGAAATSTSRLFIRGSKTKASFLTPSVKS